MKFEKNKFTGGRDFVVGDLHGCYTLLQIELEKVGFNYDCDRLFSVGDLVDRGNENMECLRLLKQPWFFAVKGNHEDMMASFIIDGGNRNAWFMNGGNWFFNKDIDRAELSELAQLAKNLPLWIEVDHDVGSIGITHGNPPHDWWDIDSMSAEFLMWSRDKLKLKDRSKIGGIDFTVHGHTPLENICALGNSLFIDTGAVFGSKLTFLNISSIPNIVRESA